MTLIDRESATTDTTDGGVPAGQNGAAAETPAESGPDFADRLASMLGDAIDAEAVTAEYAALLQKLVRNTEHLVDERPEWLCEILHPNFRWSVTDEGAPPGDMPVLTAPDLRVDTPGSAPISLSEYDPAEFGSALGELHQLVEERRAMPYFSPEPLTLKMLTALLETSLGNREMLFAYNRRDVPSRRYPSAGGLQPIDTYVAAHNVEGVPIGIYHYNPVASELMPFELGDPRVRLIDNALQTDWLFHAPVVLIFVTNLDRVLWKYGTRGYRFSHVDTGVATMNVLLTAQALGLFSNPVAAFDDDLYNEMMGLNGRTQFVNLLIAAGHKPARWS